MHFIGVLFGGDLSLLEDFYEGLEVESYIQSTKEEAIKDYIEAVKKVEPGAKRELKKDLHKALPFKNGSINIKIWQKRAWEDIQKTIKIN